MYWLDAHETLGEIEAGIQWARHEQLGLIELKLLHLEVRVTGTATPDALERAAELAELGIWLPLPSAPQLTAREREIALHASFGFSSRAIAKKLHISGRTVETHLGRVFTKLGVDNRDDLRRWYSTEYEDPWETTEPRTLQPTSLSTGRRSRT